MREPDRRLPEGRVHLERGHPGEAGRGQQHPEHRRRPRAVAVGADRRRSGRRRASRRRAAIELDPGDDRVVALRPLEVEDEQEHQGEAREPVEEGGRRGGPVDADPEQAAGRASAPPCAARPARTPAAAAPRRSGRSTTIGASQPSRPGVRQPQHQAGEARQRQQRCRGGRTSAGAAGLLPGQLAQHQRGPDGADDPERDVEPEDPVPAELRPASRRAPGRSPARRRRPSCWCPSPGRAARAGRRR